MDSGWNGILYLQIGISYQSIVNFSYSHPTRVSTEDVDDDVASVWIIDSTLTKNFLDIFLPSEEVILEEMTFIERPWDDLHHRSYFLPNFHKVKSCLYSPLSHGSVHKILSPLAPTHIFSKGNMANISKIIPVNISKNPYIVKNIFIGVDCSTEEIKIYTDPLKSLEIYSLGLMRKCLRLILL